jgi:ligand-binding sensor domain-containing protein
VFLNFGSFAQDGYLYLKHFEVPLLDNQNVFNDLSTDRQNRLLVAHRAGILQFDGKIWDKINTESSPHRFINIDDTTFVLTKHTISILEQDVFSQNILVPVFNNPYPSPGGTLVKHKRSFYYLFDKQLIRMNPESFEVDTIYKSQLGYEEVFSLNNRLFAFEQNYLLELVNGTWVDLNLYASEESDFVFSCQTDTRVFLAYDNGDFFIFDGERLEKYSSPLNEYLRENYPVSGKIINDKLLVATLSGGAIIVNINDGSIDYTIQFQNGLPADEVKAITIDQQGGIWLAHARGLSRALPNLPLKEFQHYPGLYGLPNAIVKYKDSLFVGTTEGLFYLETIKDYEQLQNVLSKRIRINNPDYTLQKEAEENSFFEELFDFSDEEVSEQEKFIEQKIDYFKALYKDQGFRFRGLREKLNEKELYLRDSIRKVIMIKGDYKASKYNYKTVKKVVNVSKIKSIKYQFTPMEGLTKKVLKLLDTPEGFFALASDGLYLIKSDKVKKIWSKSFLSDMQYDARRNILWLYGSEGLFSVNISSLENQSVLSRQYIEDPITDLCLIDDQLIVVNFNQLLHYKLSGDDLAMVGSAAISNPYSQEVFLFQKKESIQLIKADGLYAYNFSTKQLELIESYEQKQVSYFKDNKGKLWQSIDGNWQILNQPNVGEELKWLKVLPALDKVFVTANQYIYFISSNMILQLDTEAEFQLKETSSFINGAYHASTGMFTGKDIQLTHDNNSLKVGLSTPEYLFPEGVKYQYFVKGLMDEWSSWSGAMEIEFPYIPTGKYTLLVRSKTGLYGKDKEITFDFDVLPPYWKTWWFYMLEIAFFSILILISQRLNLSNRNSYITNTITFLTLILFIEFVATVLENNLEGYLDESPVYAFVLNVILAVSILPLERGMNRLFVVLNDGKKRHQKLMAEKQQIKDGKDKN